MRGIALALDRALLARVEARRAQLAAGEYPSHMARLRAQLDAAIALNAEEREFRRQVLPRLAHSHPTRRAPRSSARSRLACAVLALDFVADAAAVGALAARGRLTR